MTRHPVTVSPNDSLRKVQSLMRQGRLHRLPVTEGSRVVGIVTDRDLWERSPAGILDGGNADSSDLLDHLRVMGVMTLQPTTVPPAMPIVQAAKLLREKRVGALLVVEEGQLLGILTKSDLIDALIAACAIESRSNAPRS